MKPSPALVFCGVFTWSTSLLAETEDATSVAETSPESSQEPPPVEVGLHGMLQLGFGNVCEEDGDVTSCSTGTGFVGGDISPRWRLSRFYSIGAFADLGTSMGQQANVSSDGAHEDLGKTAWDVAAEARCHPLGERPVDPWLGLYFGLSAINDSITGYGPNDQRLYSDSATQYGPGGGVALGTDFLVAPIFALGFELRGGLKSFGHSPPMLREATPAPVYGTLAFLSLGLGGTILIPR